jgi:hypothetical protein
MTAAQKAARVKFKKAIAIRKKTGCSLKEAFASVYNKKISPITKVVKKAKKLVKKAKDAYYEGYNEAARKSNPLMVKKRKVGVATEKIGSTLKLNKNESKLGLVRKAPKKLSLPEQIGKIKMGSVFMYYKGFSIEKMMLTILGKKKKQPIFIVHEFGDTYKTLAAAKAAINFLAR